MTWSHSGQSDRDNDGVGEGGAYSQTSVAGMARAT
jgi:hypothetical protein